jgi:TP901-1 family phage major tail protein
MGCNTTQKELGGKDLLLRTCVLKTAATTNLSNEFTITAHGMVVGDILKFIDVGANTSFDVDTYYFVIEVVSANKVKIASLPTNSAIVADATEASLELDAYLLLGGLRSKSLSFSSEAIDITSQESNEWKTMLDGSGLRSVSFSGSGVYTKQDAFGALRTAFLNNNLTCLMLQDSKNQELITGCYKISSLEISGDFDAEGQYSISGDSSGPVEFYIAS